MNILLFEDDLRRDLLPFTWTRPVWDLRVGVHTLREKWEYALHQAPETLAAAWLGAKYSAYVPGSGAIWVNGRYFPNPEFIRALRDLQPGEGIRTGKDEVLAWFPASVDAAAPHLTAGMLRSMPEGRFQEVPESFAWALRAPQDIFLQNRREIIADIEAIRQVRNSARLQDRFSAVYGEDNIFVEEGVKIRAAVLNAEDGPMYLGTGADIQEGALIHGAHAICAHAVVNMGAKLRGDTTVGPYSKVGGEIANSVIWGYSNKGHDGYLGNSVLGQWCNLGADTNTSNLKNNYAEVKLWSYRRGGFARTGQQFCGLMMGDHSKCGINTMFNTGTVVGVSANIFGDGFPRNFIPDFSWGGAAGFTVYQFEKAMEVAAAVMKRRGITLDEMETALLRAVFDETAEWRRALGGAASPAGS